MSHGATSAGPDWTVLGARYGKIQAGMIHDERSDRSGDEFYAEALRRLLDHAGSGFVTEEHLDGVLAAHSAVDRANLRRAERELLEVRGQLRARVADEARIRQLEALAADMLSRFTDSRSDGWRARAGRVQVSRWQATLRGDQVTASARGLEADQAPAR